MLPSGWTVDPSTSLLVLYKCQCHPTLVPHVVFPIEVLCAIVLSCVYLSVYVFCVCVVYVTSVADAVNLATILDTSKICVGNCDDKFKRVAELNKGIFKDRAGIKY